MGGESGEEERTEVMVAVFDKVENLVLLHNMSNSDDINWNETIVNRGPRLDATTSLRSNAVTNMGGFHVTYLQNLFVAILVHTNC